MTVSELINILNHCPQDAEVEIFDEQLNTYRPIKDADSFNYVDFSNNQFIDSSHPLFGTKLVQIHPD